MKEKYRLTIHPDIDYNHDFKMVDYFETQDEMDSYQAGAANVLLFVQDDIKIMPDRSNVFIQEQFINGKYEVIYES